MNFIVIEPLVKRGGGCYMMAEISQSARRTLCQIVPGFQIRQRKRSWTGAIRVDRGAADERRVRARAPRDRSTP